MNKPQIDLTGAHILVVDDIPENLDVLLRTLESRGYSVLVAKSGEGALKVAKQFVPDLILLDVMMPGLNGYETCQKLKDDIRFAEVPIIFLTALDHIDAVVEGFDVGAVDYIVKPFNRRDVLARIRTHLERARYAKALEELNTHLEEKVAERTAQLDLKVRELEGRDRIARHMFTVHELDEVLDLVLEVIADLVELDKAMVFLQNGEDLTLTAAKGVSGELSRVSLDAAHQKVIDQVRTNSQSVQGIVDDRSFVVVPVLRDTAALGLIVVDRTAGASPVSDDEVQMLERFAIEAAMAIYDAQIRRDPSAWENQLDEIIDIDKNVDSAEFFDQFKEEE